jgi:hypothetical protein
LLLQAGVSRGSPPPIRPPPTAKPNTPTASTITQVRFDRANQILPAGDILIYNGNVTYFQNKWLGGSRLQVGVRAPPREAVQLATATERRAERCRTA